MSALRNRKKVRIAGGERATGRRMISLLLCLCMSLSILCDFGGWVLSSIAAEKTAEETKNVLNRLADPDTTDSYIGKLLSGDWGSRYAGRIWTDKSVFAYGYSFSDVSDSYKTGWDGKNYLKLDMLTDGYNGKVGFNADFGTVFSALASSQVVNEYPPSPIDLVIVFDMSASMGQDTRFGLDGGLNTYTEHDPANDSSDNTWPSCGVLMSDRIKNSRIQATLDAINKTIDDLMKQNPQNRVAVCGYGANATVLMPLAHYRRVGEAPYLTVGGMETLYHPGDLVYRKAGDDGAKSDGWYWINNRDTCYTVKVNAEKNEDTSDESLKNLDTWVWDKWTFSVSNNVRSENVKAFPGVADPTAYGDNSVNEKASQEIHEAMTYTNPDERKYTYAATTDKLITAVKETHELAADDYVGYFTNTQGGIYLAYKQLADSKVTTYTDQLSSGTTTTVARIPAAIIMSDGGANFALNKMGSTAKDWYKRFSVANHPEDLKDVREALRDKSKWTPDLKEKYFNDKNKEEDFSSGKWYVNDDTYIDGGTDEDAAVRNEDNSHRLNGNVGDEWYNVYIPSKDTLGEGWDGLHGLYNTGADIFQDGTLSSPPAWSFAGVFYSNDNDVTGTPAAVLQLLLTASYMSTVVKAHYQKDWGSVNEDSRIPLSTYTMNVDSKNVPQWGRWRLYLTLDPSDYPLDNVTSLVKSESNRFGNQYGAKEWTSDGFDTYVDMVFGAITREWNLLKDSKVSNNAMATLGINAYMSPFTGDAGNYTNTNGEIIPVTYQNVIDNIAYNDAFYDVGSEELSGIFDQILELILGTVFVPLSGENEAGVGDSITYQDPLGEYMELKNQAVKATTHKDGTTESTYDMALLLFGQMHGLVRAGVYDWHWNDEYIQWLAKNGKQINGKDVVVGETPFPMGWYKGDDPTTAETPEDIVRNDTGTWPKGYDSAEDAWEDGWVMRLDFETMLEFVPINANIDDTTVHPADAPEQIKNTVYTCYRFAGTSKERNALHRNPIYGEGVPKELQEKWDAYNGNYPVGMDEYSDYPGVYRLSDIRVWTEHTGDFIDTDGALTPEAHSGYDDSLYLNIPVAAIPTQLAEITLGPEGPLSYETNLGDDHGGMNDVEQSAPYYAQSTPIRLFYAVGLTEDLIVRDADGKQTGVDVSKISGEYIATHSDPETNNIWFISNWYSNTAYSGYTSDEEEPYRTRGDAAVTFSPSEKNRYYIFQKPLPLFAHAYRVTDTDGNLAPVDAPADHEWTGDKSGNGKTTWEGDEVASTWSGGEFLGTYKDADSFKAALKKAKDEGSKTIEDAKGYFYPLPDDDEIKNSIITFMDDQLNKVESNDDGYTDGSVSFSSDDYFFLCVEYYLPTGGTGVDINGDTVEGTTTARAVTRVIARKGSGFGSGLHSENIGNGDMLCWTDIGGKCTLEIEYNSRTDTGDNTRGRPTFEKLTYDEDDLRTYLQSCGLKDNEFVDVPNADGTTTKKSYLDLDVAYWLSVQADPNMKPLIDEIKASKDTADSHPTFDEMFDWSVAARTGGIRVGDMFQNIQAKGGGGDLVDGYYAGNVTHTANNYYIPTLSETSTAGDGLVIDNFLGNNGRLEIANSTLIVTKTLEAPDGYKLTDEQKNKYFDYQAYIQDVTGARSAQRLAWNPFSQSWQKRVESLDILTDNSSLLLDTNGNRALFCNADGTPRQVVEVVEESGTKYYYADENGLATKDVCNEAPENLYYMYLPSGEEHTYRLFGSTYEGGTTNIDGAGTTAYYPSGMSGDDMPKGDNDKQTLAEATTERPAGSRDYWTSAAELIPYTEVREAELSGDTIDSEVGLAAESVDLGRWDHEKNHGDSTADHKSLEKFTLVTVIPDTASTDSTIYSPFNSRTQYMTTDLYFGYKKELAQHLKDSSETFADCTHLSDYALSKEGLYDQTVPNADRPDLFGSLTNDMIALNTAEFQLKSGEGLMITGLDNRIVYRFTEKISEEDLAKGYTLKEISHIQQRGSESIYRPGVQKIPVYTKTGATFNSSYYPQQFRDKTTAYGLTWALTQDGEVNPDATLNYEPFNHTNAIIWEYYATMGANELGNHHHPKGVTGTENTNFFTYTGKDEHGNDIYEEHKNPEDIDSVEPNPNCEKCDVPIKDKDENITGYIHYMYQNGELVDSHYEGEASAYLRNMSRGLVSPTVHFGVKNEDQSTVPAKFPENGYYDYSGVYSTFGNTGYFAEQVHYTNTVTPEMLVLTKQVVDVEGNVVAPPDQEFTFTLSLTPDKDSVMTNPDGTLYYWRGQTDNLGKSPEENGPPALDRYTEYTDQTKEPHLVKLTLIPAEDGRYSVQIHLKANEAAVIYGLIEGTGYTVTESKIDNYPAVNPDDKTVTGEFYTQSGTIVHNTDETVSMKPDKTKNRNDFYNQMSNGSLTVEKMILDEDADSVTQGFTFTVKLDDPTLDTTKLTVTQYAKGDETGTPIESPDWTEVKDADGTTTAWTLTFTLKHGEKVKIDGIPLDTHYTVTESGKEGYNLEYVEDETGEKRLPIEHDSVIGTVEAAQSNAYLRFVNAKAPKIPSTGGIGLGLFYGLGTLILLISGAAIVIEGKKRNAQK